KIRRKERSRAGEVCREPLPDRRLGKIPHRLSAAQNNFCNATPAHAVGLISFLASNTSPLFHTAKVIAAIRRAIVTLANSGRSPLPTSSAYHALKGPYLEAVSAALLKTYLGV